MHEKLSIAIDMDDVLAKTSEKLAQQYKKRHGMRDLLELVRSKTVSERVYELVIDEFNEPGFARDLEVKRNAIKVVEALNEKYDVYIATAAMEVPGTFQDKFEWLEEHFPFLDPNHFIFCGNKKVVKADFLIDDSVHQLENFTGIGVLYTAYLNRNKKTPFKRVNNWLEVKRYFLNQYEERLQEAKEQRKQDYQNLVEEVKTSVSES